MYKQVAKRLYRKVRYLFGLKTRENIFKALPKQAVCAELGVFKGEFSEAILSYAKPREAHFIDVWWSLFGEYYPDWGEYTDRGRLKTKEAYEEAERKIRKYPGDNTIYVGSDLEYLRGFKNGHFDWVYIDSSHEYEHTKLELEILHSKVKKDGFICGHDWVDNSSHAHYGVKKAILEFCDEKQWEVIYRDIYLQWIIRRK